MITYFDQLDLELTSFQVMIDGFKGYQYSKFDDYKTYVQDIVGDVKRINLF